MRADWFATTAALCCLTGSTATLNAQGAAQALAEGRTVPFEIRGFAASGSFGISGVGVQGGDGGRELVLPGFGLRLGWGITPRFGLHIGGDVSAVESESPNGYGVGHADLVGRFNVIGDARHWAPWVEAGIGARRVNLPDYEHQGKRMGIRGSGFAGSLGAGVQWFTTPTAAVDVGLRLHHGRLTSIEITDVLDANPISSRNATSVRLSFGGTWYPMASRDRR